jgi:CBS domain-containing protein
MGLFEDFQNDTVATLNLREALTLSPDQSVRTAIEAMREKHLGCAVVVDENGRPLGLFNEVMIRASLVKNPSFVDEPLRGHMFEPVPCVTLDEPVAAVVAAMQRRNTRFVCVVDDEGKAVAMTGQLGLMEFIAENFPRQVLVERIGQTGYPDAAEGA